MLTWHVVTELAKSLVTAWTLTLVKFCLSCFLFLWYRIHRYIVEVDVFFTDQSHSRYRWLGDVLVQRFFFEGILSAFHSQQLAKVLDYMGVVAKVQSSSPQYIEISRMEVLVVSFLHAVFIFFFGVWCKMERAITKNTVVLLAYTHKYHLCPKKSAI